MAQTSDLQRRFSLVWDIRKPDIGKKLISPYFRFLDAEWRLHFLCPGLQRSRYFKIVLETEQVDVDSWKVDEPFAVVTYIESAESGFISLVSKIKVEEIEVILWEASESKLQEHFLKKNARWRIVCVFDSPPQNENETIHVSTPTYLDDLENLSLDVSNLLKDEVFPDVKLRCEGRTISAHRSILAGRSQVFADIFRKKTESDTGIVDVTDVDAPILESLLKYAYSGKITGLSDEIASSLYEAADKYAMHALKDTCCDWMLRNLTEDNCVGFLTVADLHGDAAFKDVVFSFINRHPEVIYSDVWVKFSEEFPKLANAGYRSYFMSTRIE